MQWEFPYFPLSIAIDGANRHDAALVEETLKGLQIEKPLLMAGEEHGLCMDKGYDSKEVRALAGAMDICRISVVGEKRKKPWRKRRDLRRGAG